MYDENGYINNGINGDNNSGSNDANNAASTSSAGSDINQQGTLGSTYQQAGQGGSYQQQIYNGQSQSASNGATGQTHTYQYNNGYGYAQNQYAGYNNRQTATKQPKKKGGIVKKIAFVIAAALVFGCVAGGTMVAVQSALSRFLGISQTISENSETTSPAIIGNQDNSGSSSGGGTSEAVASALDVSAIVEKAMPSVVAIHGKSTVQSYTFFGPQSYEAESSGSGIIIGENDSELLVVTNNHVVEGIDELSVTFNDENTVTANVKGRDSETDVAIIAINKSDISSDTMNAISIASIGDSDSLKVGQGVIAIGNALGYGQSVTVGYISALNREVNVDNQTTRNLLQTDAAINPGNSGGALLNMNGEVIGINSAKYSSTEVEGMGYAIPISKVQDIIQNLSNKTTRNVVEEAKQGTIGIQGQNIDENMSNSYDMPKGIYVYKILANGAAANSELQEKDIITKFDGQSVRTMAELKDMLTYYSSGDTVELTVERLNGSQYEEKTITITLGAQTDLQQN